VALSPSTQTVVDLIWHHCANFEGLGKGAAIAFTCAAFSTSFDPDFKIAKANIFTDPVFSGLMSPVSLQGGVLASQHDGAVMDIKITGGIEISL